MEHGVCGRPATSSAGPEGRTAAVPKVETKACIQIGLAQRGTGCSEARFGSPFAAVYAKCSLGAEDYLCVRLVVLAAGLG